MHRIQFHQRFTRPAGERQCRDRTCIGVLVPRRCAAIDGSPSQVREMERTCNGDTRASSSKSRS
ncbi:MAG TPA: hypothetical protein VGK99_15505 [Acidobacteriota bacterium]